MSRMFGQGGWSSGRVRCLVFAGVALLLLLVGATTAIILRTAYLHGIAQKETQGYGLARLLEQYTYDSIKAIDLVLQSINDSAPDRLDAHDAPFENWLRSLLPRLPHVRALVVIGADGWIRQDTGYPETPSLNLADRDYFIFHRDNPDGGLHISPPLVSRSANRWFVGVSRRLHGPANEFRGMVAAVVEPVFYEHFYRELRLDPGDAIALWHANETLIARAPEDFGLIGRRLGGSVLFSEHLTRARTGRFIVLHPFYGDGPRLIVYRAIPGMPLVVAAALDLGPVTRDLWRMIYVSAASFIVLSTLAFAFTIFAFRRFREREEAREREALSQRTEVLGRMTGGIAHDFNNVLANVDAALKLLLKNADAPDKVVAYGKAAADAVQRGSRLSAQLLSFAKQGKLDLESADVNELLTALNPLLEQAAGPTVDLILQLRADVSRCSLDRTQFDAAILNLVINARDAMSGRGTITIDTARWIQEAEKRATLKAGVYAVVRVSDTGPGMTPEVLARAFEPYFTTKGSGGTGIGLPQVYGFLRQIGGDARIDSAPGEGTTVALYFPCERSD